MEKRVTMTLRDVYYEVSATGITCAIEAISDSIACSAYLFGQVERGLTALDADERLVLWMLYIQPAKGNIDRLCGELCVEQATIYRKRDKALHRFTLALYGCMET